MLQLAVWSWSAHFSSWISGTVEWAIAFLQLKCLLALSSSSPPHLSPSPLLLLVRDQTQGLAQSKHTLYCRATPSVFQFAFLAVHDFQRSDYSQGHQRNPEQQLGMGEGQWIWRRGKGGTRRSGGRGRGNQDILYQRRTNKIKKKWLLIEFLYFKRRMNVSYEVSTHMASFIHSIHIYSIWWWWW